MKAVRVISTLAAVAATVAVLVFSCGKKDDDDDDTDTAAVTPTSTGTPTDQELKPIGTLSLDCGGKACIGTEAQ
jgi:hypothetical protein